MIKRRSLLNELFEFQTETIVLKVTGKQTSPPINK